MRLIDADAIPWQECLDTNGYAEPLDKVIAVIQNMSYKGQWIRDAENFGKYYCSKCGFSYIPIDVPKHNFCPNCGSDNREVEE